jgi:tetratricopeptide (TPR) repeat protein
MARHITASAIAATLLAATALSPADAATCKAGIMADLSITMQGWRPIVQTTIDGRPAPFILDSGASYSMMPPSVAKAFDVHLQPAPFGMRMKGIGGDSDVGIATVRHFGLAGADISQVQFLVGGSDVGQTGLLGQNVLGIGDVEYDLPGGHVRLFRAAGCGKLAMAYWTGGKPYFEIAIEPRQNARSHTIGTTDLDGAKLRTVFDTGAAETVLTLKAAARAGVHPGDPGVEKSGWETGIGRHVTQGWTGRFKLLKIGNEELHNVRLRFADLGPSFDNDMLLGADWFVSHRLYVANSQHRIYFTYTGGRLFDVTSHVDAASEIAAVGAPDAAAPMNAEGYSQRGAMLQTQHELAQAIDAFSHAVALAPKEPRYVRQRALAYIADHRPVLAMDDLGTTLALDPTDVRARLLRAELRMHARNDAGAISDLDDAAGRLAKEDNQRLWMGQLYLQSDAFDAAIGQFDLWLASHREDARRAEGQNGRCWARVLANKDLDAAKADCTAAVRAVPMDANFLDGRGLVALRQGAYDAAIADFTAALGINPKLGWALYGRGLAERHLGRTADADRDLAAAQALSKTIAERAKRYGFA